MLTSLFLNNAKNKLRIFILVDSLLAKNEAMLCELAKTYGQTLEFIHIDQNKFKSCPVRIGDHVSLVTYYRLLAPYLLPQDVGKVLYLDCDMLVIADLAPLWDLEIENHPLAGCMDEDFAATEKYNRLNYPMSFGYINAGMLIMNLDYWRKHSISEACFDYITSNSEKLSLHDQDTVNYVLRGKILPLPPRYNLQTGYLYKNYFFGRYSGEFRQRIWEAIATPAIIHYTGSVKPWKTYHSNHPYTLYFTKYQVLSLWKTEATPKGDLRYYLKRIYRHFRYAFGLANVPERFIITQQVPPEA
jgi:lipopolysaccharide biosynthesis glycosyltransferase